MWTIALALKMALFTVKGTVNRRRSSSQSPNRSAGLVLLWKTRRKARTAPKITRA